MWTLLSFITLYCDAFQLLGILRAGTDLAAHEDQRQKLKPKLSKAAGYTLGGIGCHSALPTVGAKKCFCPCKGKGRRPQFASQVNLSIWVITASSLL